MNQRLQKLISAAGLCSRRKAEEWIAEGKVTVNGVLARLGDSADPSADLILVDGQPLPAAPAQTAAVLLYKPRGYVTTLSDEKGRPTVADLLPPELGRLYPVGRLDQFSEGLLLMTNDGDLANRLTHPKGEVDKTYRLWVSGWHEAALELLRRPIVLDGRPIKPPAVRLLWTREGTGNRERGTEGNRQQATGNRGREENAVGAHRVRLPQAASADPALPPVGAAIGRPPEAASAWTAEYDHVPEAGQSYRSAAGGDRQTTALLEITIHEGRNRQIRRMAEAAGLTPTRLKRIAEGPITLGELKPAEWRMLTDEERKNL